MDVIVNASLSSILFFNLAGAVALNIIYFLVNAIDGLRGGGGAIVEILVYSRNGQCLQCIKPAFKPAVMSLQEHSCLRLCRVLNGLVESPWRVIIAAMLHRMRSDSQPHLPAC